MNRLDLSAQELHKRFQEIFCKNPQGLDEAWRQYALLQNAKTRGFNAATIASVACLALGFFSALSSLNLLITIGAFSLLAASFLIRKIVGKSFDFPVTGDVAAELKFFNQSQKIPDVLSLLGIDLWRCPLPLNWRKCPIEIPVVFS